MAPVSLRMDARDLRASESRSRWLATTWVKPRVALSMACERARVPISALNATALLPMSSSESTGSAQSSGLQALQSPDLVAATNCRCTRDMCVVSRLSRIPTTPCASAKFAAPTSRPANRVAAKNDGLMTSPLGRPSTTQNGGNSRPMNRPNPTIQMARSVKTRFVRRGMVQTPDEAADDRLGGTVANDSAPHPVRANIT